MAGVTPLVFIVDDDISVVRGQFNKQVGGELGISEITVKAHRGRVMRKMRARSLLKLVHIATRLGLNTSSKG